MTAFVDSLPYMRCKSDINQYKVNIYYQKDSKPLHRKNSLEQTFLFHLKGKIMNVHIFSGESFEVLNIHNFFRGREGIFQCTHSILHAIQNVLH